MRKNKLPEFMLLLEQFFTEYMPLSSGLSPNTTRSYKHAFRLLFQYVYQEKKKNAGEILFRDLNFETIDGFLKWIEAERGCSVSTRNLRLSALASFAGYAQNRNFEAATVFANAVKRVPVKKEAVQPRTTFTLDEVSILLRLPDPGKRMGFRDQVLLNLMYASGARAQEICDLKVRDFLAEKNLYKLTITGKGNKTRRIVIARPSGTLLERYLEETGKAGRLEAYIFSSQTHPQMSISCIEEIYKKYIMLARAGHPEMFLEKRYTPHTMRHTTATHMLEAGVPIMAIKNFLAHSSISTATAADFDFDKIFEGVDWFHFTGITPAVSDSAAVLTEEALKAAKKHGVTVSVDLNFRKKLWSSEKAQKVMKNCPDAVSIFLMPPSIKTLEKRLIKRNTETEEQIVNRLRIAEEEIKSSSMFNYVVVNNELDKAVDEINEILNKELEKRNA